MEAAHALGEEGGRQTIGWCVLLSRGRQPIVHAPLPPSLPPPPDRSGRHCPDPARCSSAVAPQLAVIAPSPPPLSLPPPQTALAVIARIQHGALLRSLHSWRCFMALRMRRHMADRHAAVT